MGILVLTIFVCGSLAFSVWAWRGYETRPKESDRSTSEGQGSSLAFPILVTVGGSFLEELLRHYTKWSFGMRMVLCLFVVVLTQYLLSGAGGTRHKDQGTAKRPTQP